MPSVVNVVIFLSGFYKRKLLPDSESKRFAPKTDDPLSLTGLSKAVTINSCTIINTLYQKGLYYSYITYTVMYMKNNSMVRTQVYLSREQEQALKSLALTSGARQSELIREAVDLLLLKKNASQKQWKQSLHDMKGMWSDDEDAEQRMQSIREEFDR